MRIEAKLLRPILESLYADSFPDYCLLVHLTEKLELKDHLPIAAALHYLEGKGLVKLHEAKSGPLSSKITADGIDVVEERSLL